MFLRSLDLNRRDLPLLAWLLFASGVMVFYRAATQSFTIDEAFSYHLFFKQDWHALFGNYDAAYHGLHTWATWAAKHTLGKAEWVLRLPSILAALAYLAGSALLARRLFGPGLQAALATVALTANPFLADYYTAARGYGAALAFLLWALLALLDGRTRRASVLCGLSVACNLTFLVPAAALSTVYLALGWKDPRHLFRRFLELLLPFLLTASLLLAPMLVHLNKESLYFGADDFRLSLRTLLDASLAHPHRAAPAWTYFASHHYLPLFAAALLALFALGLWRRARPLILTSGTLIVSVAILLAGHALTGALYPFSRTGLYLIWLAAATLVSAWGAVDRWPRHLLALPCLALILANLAQFDTRYYYDFREDAGLRPLLEQLYARNGARPVCIGGSWRFETTVNYYRERYRFHWIQPMQRTPEPAVGCPYLALAIDDAPAVHKLNLEILWSDPLSGAILARPGKPGRSGPS